MPKSNVFERKIFSEKSCGRNGLKPFRFSNFSENVDPQKKLSLNILKTTYDFSQEIRNNGDRSCVHSAKNIYKRFNNQIISVEFVISVTYLDLLRFMQF